MSPSELAKTHRALALAQGDRTTAAIELGVTREVLDASIASNSELKQLWGSRSSEPPTVAQSMTREKPASFDLVEDDIPPRDAALAAAYADQAIKVQKFDWEGLGLKDAKTLALMKQFEGTGVGRGVLKMMDAMQGGMAYCFAKVSRQFADVSEELELEMAKPLAGDKETRRDETRVLLLHTRFMDLAREMQKFNKEATAAAHTRLLIADRAKKINQAGNRMRTPGWKKVGDKGPNG